MKKYRLILFIIIILTIVAVVLYFNNTTSTIKKELRDFAVEDTASINKIFIVDKSSNSVKLEKNGNKWKVNNKFFARKDAVNLLLKTMKNLTVKSPIPKSKHNTIVKRLSAQSIKVEIYKEDELIKRYYVGGPTTTNLGTYMLLEGSSTPFVMHIPGFRGFLSPRFFTDENSWRSTAVFNYKFDDIISVKVDIHNKPDKSFKLHNYGDNKFALEAYNQKKMIENFDTLKIKQYLSLFKRVNYQALMDDFTKEKKDSILSETPYYTFTVENKNGEKKIVKTYKMLNIGRLLNNKGEEFKFDPDQLYAKPESFKEIVTVQYYVFDPLLKELDYFIKE